MITVSVQMNVWTNGTARKHNDYANTVGWSSLVMHILLYRPTVYVLYVIYGTLLFIVDLHN